MGVLKKDGPPRSAMFADIRTYVGLRSALASSAGVQELCDGAIDYTPASGIHGWAAKTGMVASDVLCANWAQRGFFPKGTERDDPNKASPDPAWLERRGHTWGMVEG